MALITSRPHHFGLKISCTSFWPKDILFGVRKWYVKKTLFLKASKSDQVLLADVKCFRTLHCHTLVLKIFLFAFVSLYSSKDPFRLDRNSLLMNENLYGFGSASLRAYAQQILLAYNQKNQKSLSTVVAKFPSLQPCLQCFAKYSKLDRVADQSCSCCLPLSRDQRSSQ